MDLLSWMWGGVEASPAAQSTVVATRDTGLDAPRPTRRHGQQSLQASYDAASTSSLMANSWLLADNLSADEANNPGTRQVARSRSRYECLEANSFIKGAIHTYAQDLIGRGPRLQLNLPNEAANRKVEQLWQRWSRARRFAKALRTHIISRIVDGEGFGLFTTSDTIDKGMPTLLFRPFEADRCMSPWGTPYRGDLQVDGMRIDEEGEPVSYFVYDEVTPLKVGTPREIDRRFICHLYRSDRAGQHRGIPELFTSLPLCVLLREYTLATVSSARTVAKHTAVIESQASTVTADGMNVAADLEPYDAAEVDYDMITTLPYGWRMNQLRAEQPTTNYEMFRDCLLGEIVRPLGAPLNIVLGSSAKWNYASTQADHISYALKQLIEREEVETETVDRCFALWWHECRIMGLLPNEYADLTADEAAHSWFWDSRRDADPQTMATARETNLRNGVTNRADELAAQGKDYQQHDETAAKSLGLDVEQYRQLLARQTFGSATVDTVLQSSETGATSTPMNGAQLQSLSAILAQVGQGLIAPAPARAMVQAAFPSLSNDRIALMFPDRPPDPAPQPAAGTAPEPAAPTNSDSPETSP